MSVIKRAICTLCAAVLVLIPLAGCVPAASPDTSAPTFASFRDIPGITSEEIAAIEKLQATGEPLVYAALSSGEAFELDGENRGFAALYCRRMTELFGIEFRLELQEWSEIQEGLDMGAVAFTGEMTATDERRAAGYLMTDAIAQRSIKFTQRAGDMTPNEIAETRKPRFAFLRGAKTVEDVTARADYEFEAIFADGVEDAYQMLALGEVDAFLGENARVIIGYGSLVIRDFFPIINNPVSMTTKNPALAPVISVVDKALQEDGFRQELKELYRRGQDELKQYELLVLLSPEEKAYISNNPVIPIAAEHYNYPISFFNAREQQWSGIVLSELEKYTGLDFQLAHDEKTEWPELLKMLEAGDAYVISELLPSQERQGRFLWPQKALLTDYYTLISKSDAPDINVTDVQDYRVGIQTDTAYDELFKAWFPDHPNVVEFDNPDVAFAAVARGEIDMVMSSQRQLIALTNYLELTGYKSNITFERQSESIIGFNINHKELQGIFDKALNIIDVDEIAEQWTQRTYDYQSKLVQAQRPWFIGAAALLLCVVVLLFLLFQRTRRAGKRLGELVAKRTHELEVEKNMIQLMFDSTPNLAFCKDVNLKFTRCNKSFEDYLGVSEKDILGKNNAEGLGFSTGSAGMFDKNERVVIAECRTIVIEEDVPNHDGTIEQFETTKIPLVVNGKVTGLMGIAHNITERKAMEESIREAQERAWLMLNATPLACRLWNRDLQIIECNDAVLKLYGLKDKQEYLDRFSDLMPEYQPDGQKSIEKIHRYVAEAFETGSASYEVLFRALDGTPMPAENMLFRVRYGDDYVVAAYSRDLREQKKMIAEIENTSAQLAVALDDAKAANSAKSSFLAHMSHEIRTPLNAVVGFTELTLGKEALDCEIKDQLEKIHASGMTILSIVNDILDISKIESGKFEIYPVQYDTPSLINDIVTLNIVRIGEKPIKFKLSVDENLPALLYGDELRVKQIFNNLLSNAFKYTNEGTVSWRMAFECDGGDVWLVSSIEDTGIGMKPESVQKLFTDYNQVDAQTNRKVEGTGLGLAITKRLVEMMGGTITVESEYGKGSVFSIRLRQGFVTDTPIGKAAAHNLAERRYALVKRGGQGKLARVDLSYAHVLIVDDIVTNLDVVKGMMKPYGVKIDCALSGPQAIEMIRAGRPSYSAVFMDHMMPGMDGIEATRIIREEIGTDYAQNIPIIALTANAIIGNEEMFLSHGFQDFISKPIDMAKLDASLRRWVRDKEREKALIGAEENAATSDQASADMEAEPSALSAGIIIDGLDIQKALNRFGGDEAALIDVLRSYAANTPPLIGKLDEYLAREDMDGYGIVVHGIKGASYGIFAEEAGRVAEALEAAAKAGETDVVKAGHSGFTLKAEALISAINTALAEIDAAVNLPAAAKPDPALLQELRDACGAFDMNRVDTAMEQLDSFKYERGGELVTWLREQVNNMDFEIISAGEWPSE